MKILVCAPLQEAESKKIQEYFINDTVVISRRPTQEDIDQVDVIVGNPHLDLNLNQEHLQTLNLPMPVEVMGLPSVNRLLVWWLLSVKT